MGVIGQIDLSKFERKDPFKNLNKKVELLSLKLNNEIKNKYEFNNLINTNGSVSMEAFSNKKGGIYEENEIENDNLKIKEIESGFIGLDKDNVRNFYKTKFGLTKDEDILKKWKKNRENQKSSKVEKLITLLLNKAMGNKFIVVKSSTYDDYTAGVDHLIIDKENGNVVGAFDEVAENDNSSGNKNTISKEEKINKIINKGGAFLKYGFRIKNGKLEMTKLENLPIFYLSLNDENYNKLSKNIDNQDEEITKNEKEVFSELISSLKLQINNAKKQNLKNDLLQNINQFEESLKLFK